jgi:hypothetical protein
MFPQSARISGTLKCPIPLFFFPLTSPFDFRVSYLYVGRSEVSHMGTIRSYRMKSGRPCRFLNPFREGGKNILANWAVLWPLEESWESQSC